MGRSTLAKAGLCAFVCLSFMSGNARAGLPSDPVHDPNFLILPDGRDLRNVKVSGAPLFLERGMGAEFGAQQKTAYFDLKNKSKSMRNYPVQWVLMDLDKGTVIDQSLTPTFKIFGASVTKIYAAATLLDLRRGRISDGELKTMSDMLVISDNNAWKAIQRLAGNGNDDRGREANWRFTQRMGYELTRGFQGNWNGMHGNELNSEEIAEFLRDTYRGNYPGAEYLWKVLFTVRTGDSRGKKYLPKSLYVGGKTGSYSGKSIDPQTGSSTGANGKPFEVEIHNHVIVFNVDNRQFALAMLANSGSDESTALLAGGLFREIHARRY